MNLYKIISSASSFKDIKTYLLSENNKQVREWISLNGTLYGWQRVKTNARPKDYMELVKNNTITLIIK